MTRRRWTLAIAAALAACAAVVAVIESPASSAAGSAPLATSGPPPTAVRPRRVHPDHRPPPQPGGHVDVARVEAALARLEATTARITPEQLADEQTQMVRAKARFEAIQIPEPTTREFTDDQGLRWIELRHASGEVRYVLAPEPEAPAAGSGSAAR
jgi:hypothetical protein